jgi:four helix bundle suffix protein
MAGMDGGTTYRWGKIDMASDEPLIPKHGGYRKLKTFQLAQIVYDITVRFTRRYVDGWSRTRDQMIQAARSGVQNIAEGSQASGTSKKTEIKLIGVARASLEELKVDYEDFLRHRKLPLWDRNDPRRSCLVNARCISADEVAEWVKQVRDGQIQKPQIHPDRSKLLPHKSIPSIKSTYPKITANAVLVLLGVTCSLLDRQLNAQGEAFKHEGGFSERLYRIRTHKRDERRRPDAKDPGLT